MTSCSSSTDSLLSLALHPTRRFTASDCEHAQLWRSSRLRCLCRRSLAPVSDHGVDQRTRRRARGLHPPGRRSDRTQTSYSVSTSSFSCRAPTTRDLEPHPEPTRASSCRGCRTRFAPPGCTLPEVPSRPGADERGYDTRRLLDLPRLHGVELRYRSRPAMGKRPLRTGARSSCPLRLPVPLQS